MNKKEKMVQDLQKAYESLEQINMNSKEDIVQDAAIQRFEFSYELSWKIMQNIAIANGMDSYGPKNAIRNAAQLKLIEDPEEWLIYLNYRNLTTHTYGQETAREVFSALPRFKEMLKSFLKVLEKSAI